MNTENTNIENTEVQLSEHEQAMIDKVDSRDENLENNLSSDNQTEEKYAGKFNSTEDLEKAYLELQKKFSQGKTEETTETVEETKEETNETDTKENVSEEEAKDIVNEKGFDFDELSNEFVENGELSEETYKKLQDSGIPKEMVDSYIEGQQAILNQRATEIYNTIGGEAEYNNMVEWASENLSEEEKNTFNEAINQNDNIAKFTIQNLYSRYKSNTPGKLITGEKNSTPSRGYETKTDMQKDINSPAYKRDAQFRAIVQNKIKNTDWL